MKIIKINDSFKSISLVPRVLPNDGDILLVKLRNESTDIEEEMVHTWDYVNNYFTLNLPTTSDIYEVDNDYELKIFRNNSLIYLGKVRIIDQTDSIQDYQITSAPTPTTKIYF